MKKVACILVLIAVLSVIAAEDVQQKIFEKYMDKPTEELFKVYHFLFKKDYNLESDEGMRRYTVFKQNVNFIKEQRKNIPSYGLEFTAMTDLKVEGIRDQQPDPDTEPIAPGQQKDVIAMLYLSCNYKGTSVSVTTGISNLTTNKNVLFSSGKKGTTDELKMYLDLQCKGEGFPLESDEPCFDQTTVLNHFKANKKVKSISVFYSKDLPKDDCIAVYISPCFTGTKTEFCTDVPDLSLYKIDNLATSIKFGKNVKNVAVFMDANYGGLGYAINQSISNMDQGPTRAFASKISSIRIFK